MMMSEHPSSEEEHRVNEIEYVGSPTEFADADEVPEWVATAAKILFFLPAALVTASTIPFLFLGLVVVMCACLIVFGSLVSAL